MHFKFRVDGNRFVLLEGQNYSIFLFGGPRRASQGCVDAVMVVEHSDLCSLVTVSTHLDSY